jgi:hypothetical protein
MDADFAQNSKELEVFVNLDFKCGHMTEQTRQVNAALKSVQDASRIRRRRKRPRNILDFQVQVVRCVQNSTEKETLEEYFWTSSNRLNTAYINDSA